MSPLHIESNGSPPLFLEGVADTAAPRAAAAGRRWGAGEAWKHQKPSAHPTAAQHWSPQQDGLLPEAHLPQEKEFRLIKTTYLACFLSHAETFVCDCTIQEILLEETAVQRVCWLLRSLPGIWKVWVMQRCSWCDPGISATNPSMKHWKSSPKHGAACGFFRCFPVPTQLTEMGTKQLRWAVFPFEGFAAPYFTFWTHISYRLVRLAQNQMSFLLVTHATVKF